MPRDDRDLNFEKALARNLHAPAPQSTAPANATPSDLASPSSHTVDCPDAEILAAYHERFLAPDEMISRKLHIAACPRCQAILAQLEATDEIPLESDVEELAPAAVPTAVFAQVAGAAPPAAAPSNLQAVAKFPSAAEMPRRRAANWRWLAPAGALAAALLVWVAVHESHPPQFQLAKNQPQPLPSNLPAAPPAPVNETKQTPAATGVPLLPRVNSPVTMERGSMRSPRVPLELRTPQPSGMRAPSSSNLAASAGTNPGEPARENPSAGAEPLAPPEQESKGKAFAKSSIAPALQVHPQSATRAVDNLAAAPSAPKAETRAKNDTVVAEFNAAPAARAQATSAGTFAVRETVASQEQNPVLITSPIGTVTWRLLPAGIIEQSTNQGAITTLQKTGVVADLLVGSAVSNKVCWVAGRTGTILRTTDGGTRWRQVSSPTTEDIVNIFAIDDRQATIITATQLYSTVNAGKTWTPHAKPKP
jgi:hypothetical protein